MISAHKKVLVILTTSFLASCSQVLETVTLKLDKADPLEQEQFTVGEKTLTISEAKAGNSLPLKGSSHRAVLVRTKPCKRGSGP